MVNTCSAFSPSSGGFRNARGLTTKLKVHCAIVVTTLQYACETWTVYSRHTRQLNHFYLWAVCTNSWTSVAWYGSPHKGQHSRCALSSSEGLSHMPEMGRTCDQHTYWSSAKTAAVWRALSGRALSWRTEKALQGYLESILEKLQYWGHLLGDLYLWPLLEAHYQPDTVAAQKQRITKAEREKAAPKKEGLPTPL